MEYDDDDDERDLGTKYAELRADYSILQRLHGQLREVARANRKECDRLTAVVAAGFKESFRAEMEQKIAQIKSLRQVNKLLQTRLGVQQLSQGPAGEDHLDKAYTELLGEKLELGRRVAQLERENQQLKDALAKNTE